MTLQLRIFFKTKFQFSFYSTFHVLIQLCVLDNLDMEISREEEEISDVHCSIL